MKRFVIFLMCALLIFTCIGGCEKNDFDPNGSEDTTSANEQKESTDTAIEPTTDGETTEEETTIFDDDTPKKYFTLAFDDGITQDLKIIELLNKYNVNCCTFYVNTGLAGADWSAAVSMLIGREVTHKRFTVKELKSGIYEGFDVGSHTSTHPTMSGLSSSEVINEVNKDLRTIEACSYTRPVGMAWPGGDGLYTDENVLDILNNTDIRFARGTTSTYSFALPNYFMTWYPTVAITDERVLTLAESFIEQKCDEDQLFYVWGHGYELDAYDKWETLESLIAMMSKAADDGEIVLVTQTGFYQLYKDKIPSWGDDAHVK